MQMLGGALVPGKPVANMYFTLYGYNSVIQAYTLTGDLKIVRPLPEIANDFTYMPLSILGSVHEAAPACDLPCPSRWICRRMSRPTMCCVVLLD